MDIPPLPVLRLVCHPKVLQERCLSWRSCRYHPPFCIRHFPCMRETHGQPLVLWPLRRFIPAYAGNTSRIAVRSTRCAVHPRVCGEHFKGGPWQAVAIGSSPRMRGTRWGERGRHRCARFIPAYAGNTIAPLSLGAPSPVHPRVCGEHGCERIFRLLRRGSSPRMRGTLRNSVVEDEISRFIPAYAGNTSPWPASVDSTPVHPRVCGEHSSSL